MGENWSFKLKVERAASFNCDFFPSFSLDVAAATAKLSAKGSEGQHSLKAKPSRCDGGGDSDDSTVTGTTQTEQTF